jgi:hypothetical protein
MKGLDSITQHRERAIRRQRSPRGSSIAEAAASLVMFLILGFGLYDLAVFLIGVSVQDSATKEMARAMASASGTVGGPGSAPGVPGVATVGQVVDGQVSLDTTAQLEIPRIRDQVLSEYNKNPLFTLSVDSIDYNQSMKGFVIVKTSLTSHLIFPRLPFVNLGDPITKSQACEAVTIAPFAGN